MSLVAVGAVKGSPGTTTAAVGIAGAWPPAAGRPVVLVEADPAGGTLARWFPLAEHPGLLSWAAAARTGPAPVGDHAQKVRDGLTVVAAPVGPRQTRGALAVLADTGTVAAAAVDGAVLIVDCGRLDPGSPSLPIVAAADLVVLLVEPDPYELARLASLTEGLADSGQDVVVVLAGRPRWQAAEVQAAIGLPVVGILPRDPRGAAALTATTRGRRHSRRPLVRATAAIAAHLAGRLAAPASALVPSSDGTVSPAPDAAVAVAPVLSVPTLTVPPLPWTAREPGHTEPVGETAAGWDTAGREAAGWEAAIQGAAGWSVGSRGAPR